MNDAEAGQWTVLKLLNWTKDYLGRAGVESPRLCAEIILAHVLGCKRIELYVRFQETPDAPRLAEFRELIKRAAAHEPVAYLTGHKEFYSLNFKVTPDVLIPRPETEILVSEAITFLKTEKRSMGILPMSGTAVSAVREVSNKKEQEQDAPATHGRDAHATLMWDACTGSGCIAVAVAANIDNVTVLATDISPATVKIAAENVASHKLSERINCRVADLLNLPQDCSDLKDFDVITTNPPYIPAGQALSPEVAREPQVALRGGPDGLDYIKRIIHNAPALLRPGGMLIMEFGFDQSEKVRQIADGASAFSSIKIIQDTAGLDRVLVAVRR